MNKYGFIIEKLELLGDNVESVSIEFTKGLNVIYGPSDTGKTFIFQCIYYMLGASKKPKKIPEAEKFNKIKLYIKTNLDKQYILERALNGGDFKLFNSETDSKTILKAKNDKNSPDETISKFLLQLSNINKKEVLKNQKGEKQIIYFQDLLKYFLIDEEKIITEKSIIAHKPDRGYNALKTFEENVFKFLLTGQDDSSIVVSLKPKEIQHKIGKIELYNELISQVEEQLKDIDYKQVDKQIERLNSTIDTFKNQELSLSEELNQLNSEKNELTKKIDSDKKSLISLDEILKRSYILKKQYESDIARLQANIEVGVLFPTKKASCPVCDNDIVETVDIEKIISATKIEISKTYNLLDEVKKSEQIFLEEKINIENSIKESESKLNVIIQDMEEKVNNEIQEIISKIQSDTDKKEELVKIKLLKDNLDDYKVKRDEIQNIIDTNKKNNKKTNYEKLTASMLDPIITNIKTILESINFENITNTNIGFSEENLDIVIGSKNRKDYGKGYRAILYAIFIISVLEFLRNRDYQIGLTVIDSPLNPYKPDDKDDNGKIAINLAEEFYKYLAKNIIEEQVILIENTPIPDDIKGKVNYIEFTKEKGFLPSIGGYNV